LAKSSDSPIPLLWKENTEGEMLTNMDNMSNVISDNSRRMSSRNKKPPITRNKDFLWEVPTSTMQKIGTT
jgi:hypothetical protein